MLDGTLRRLLRPKTTRNTQSMNKLSNQLRKMSGALVIAEDNAGQLVVPTYSREPIRNRW